MIESARMTTHPVGQKSLTGEPFFLLACHVESVHHSVQLPLRLALRLDDFREGDMRRMVDASQRLHGVENNLNILQYGSQMLPSFFSLLIRDDLLEVFFCLLDRSSSFGKMDIVRLDQSVPLSANGLALCCALQRI